MPNRYLPILLVILLSIGSASCTPRSLPYSTATLELIEITVNFTDRNRYAQGIPPFEVQVIRWVDSSSNLAEATMLAFFEGPTKQERDQGLELIASGFTGFSSLTIEDGIARIYLTGECRSLGATYTIAQPIMRNLLQFADVQYVKIYDVDGNTEEPEGRSNSIPFCLEP